MGVDLLSPTGELLWMRAYLPDPPPVGWRLRSRLGDGAAYQARSGQVVILSGSRQDDGRRWVHLSTSFADRLPTWADLRNVKDLFLGPDLYAVQVMPPRALYVNIHPHVLHLFACADGWPLPEFSGVLPNGARSL